MSTTIQNIAIIGAGIGGLALALGLHSKNIQCIIYEQSPESGRFSGAIMLSPNSLRILDSYGVYERIRSKGWSFESADVKTAAGQTTDRYFLGSQKLFGYKALRIYRNIFVKELQAVVKERGVPIVFDTKYSHVVVETQDGVRIAFKDSAEVSVSLLIGADGIHSRVRGYVAPGIEPIYNGIVSVVGAVKRSKSVILSDETISGPLMYGGKAGSFVLAPQDVDGSTLMAGTQKKYPMQDREGWARLASDKEALRGILYEDIDSWPEIVSKAIQGIDMDSVYIWPQHVLPHLPKWNSDAGKVLLIGDAAHCIPPTTGQGGGQAIEDGFTLSLILSKVSEKISMVAALKHWQNTRQLRVDKLLDLTSKMNNMRLPVKEQQKLAEGEIWRDEEQGKGEGSSMEWLFLPRLEEDILSWVEQRGLA